MFTRRTFMKQTTAAVGAAAAGTLGGRCSGSTPLYGEGPLEGIYTDRFTFRQGEPIGVHLALSSGADVEVLFKRHDRRNFPLVESYTVRPTPWQRIDQPGKVDPEFGRVLEIPTTGLGPGLYKVYVPPEALSSENRVNDWNGFRSNNNVARFVVTSAQPGSHSRVLFLFDSLTGTAYGGFGGASIYGAPGHKKMRTVSHRRPGLDRATDLFLPLLTLYENGIECEFMDLVALAEAPPGTLDAWDLVLVFGPFEYTPHAVLAQLANYLDGGGNLFVASNEFAIFRVRLDGARMTTYKYQAESLDPFASLQEPELAELAGVGMNNPASFFETEITGQTVWAAYQMSPTPLDLPLFGLAEAGWIVEGTGLGEGDALPGAARNFTAGNLVDFSSPSHPAIAQPELTRTPAETLVWGALPSPAARAWWLGVGQTVGQWPTFEGCATATLQQRASGATVVSLPRGEMMVSLLGNPIYEQLLLNVVDRLSVRA